MSKQKLSRKKAIIRRNIFLSLCALLLVLVIALVAFIIKSIVSGPDDNDVPSDITSSDASSLENTSSKNDSSSQQTTSSEPDEVTIGNYTLDANFSSLLLVNGQNPLPDTYDSEVRASLVEIDPQYRNNNYVTQIHKDVYPYITAMVATAQSEGVDLRVWSPFRSYAIQNDLFQKQVNRVGGDEAKAATVVARPGTSEHNTGLCADFNMASDAFENTPMYTWMTENAENFGFVMRYRKDKQPITGVIHESWHWRFVGIKHAKEMNRLDMCLEEYVEYLENKSGKEDKTEKIADN